jgi:hypothetical protein
MRRKQRRGEERRRGGKRKGRIRRKTTQPTINSGQNAHT